MQGPENLLTGLAISFWKIFIGHGIVLNFLISQFYEFFFVKLFFSSLVYETVRFLGFSSLKSQETCSGVWQLVTVCNDKI